MFTRRVSSETQRHSSFCTPYNVGVNSMFLPLIPYTIVTGLHDTNLELALILGTAFSGGIIVLGLVLRFAGGYRSWPSLLELMMLVVNAVLLGVSYSEEHDITKYHNFIANTVYAAFSVLSLMFMWPFTLQYVREFVPPSALGHSKVIGAAYATTSAWAVAFVANTLIYLVPICRGRAWEHSNVLNLLFRIILPVFIALFAAIFTRVWPVRVVQHLVDSIGFDGALRKVVVNPLALPATGGPGLPPLGYLPPALPPGLTPVLAPGVPGGPPPAFQIQAFAV